MVYSRLKSSQAARFRIKAAAFILVGLAAFAAGTRQVNADPVASDGAVGVNAAWENGNSANWYIELQRQGIFSIVGGIRSENDSEIRAGLKLFDWGFAHQGSDGSFTGTAGGATGQEFHSTSLFLEAAARTTLMLKAYAPITYVPDANFYNNKIAQYTAAIHAAAQWLTDPTVAAAGQAYNQPFTHRRYLLAATLAEAGTLTGDTALIADATPYIQDGLNRQLPFGWHAAIQKTRTGALPPATLIPPTAEVPRGAVLATDATGINPEQYGYDTLYQTLGLYCANVYLPYCTNPMMKQRLLTMIKSGLTWESHFISPSGQISIAGDTRMGVELDRSGVVKMPSKGLPYGAFNLGSDNTGSTLFATYATRVNMQGEGIDTNAVASDGAVDSNSAYDTNSSAAWSIGSQKIGVDYVEAGIAAENDGVIQTGLQIINWGFSHQSADGSFGATSSPFYGTTCFIECAARAAHDLQQYDPETYTPTSDYQSWAAGTLAKCVSSCGWLTAPATTRRYNGSIAASTSHEWIAAAALAETGAYSGNPSLQTAANAYASNAINLQTSSGEDPENGSADVNYQAIGLNAALHFSAACADAPTLASTLNAADKGLVWEGQNINPSGTVTGTSSPAIRCIMRAFALAQDLPHSAYFQVSSYRLGGPPAE